MPAVPVGTRTGDRAQSCAIRAQSGWPAAALGVPSAGRGRDRLRTMSFSAAAPARSAPRMASVTSSVVEAAAQRRKDLDDLVDAYVEGPVAAVDESVGARLAPTPPGVEARPIIGSVTRLRGDDRAIRLATRWQPQSRGPRGHGVLASTGTRRPGRRTATSGGRRGGQRSGSGWVWHNIVLVTREACVPSSRPPWCKRTMPSSST